MAAGQPAPFSRRTGRCDVTCASFLASEKAGYITGSMIRVDGGRIRGMV